MKKLFIILALAGCGTNIQAHARRVEIPSVRYLSQPQAAWQGDSLRIRFTSQLQGRLDGPVSLRIAPILVAGQDTVRYPELGYFTPSGARYHRRSEELSTAQQEIILRQASRRDTAVQAEYAVARLVPPSLAVQGRLYLQQYLYGCSQPLFVASTPVDVPQRAFPADTAYIPVQTPRGLLPLPVAAVSIPLFEANVTFLRPEDEPVKERSTTATVRITYPQNGAKVLPEFGQNLIELARIDHLRPVLEADTTAYHIERIFIEGYTSPEGTYDYNMRLSARRAKGMREYLCKRYGLAEQRVEIEGHGEDWDGLCTALAESDIEAKDEALSIIDRYEIFDGREKRLMDLRAGRPYRRMFREIFPRLRRMEMRIDYRVRPFGPEESEVLLESRPQDLSLREFYDAAQARNDDQGIVRCRSEYGREYDVAVRYFPDDDIANINASSAALVRGDLEAARICLVRVQENPLANNNLGVYHWLCGKLREAEGYFRKALETDHERAAYNLEQLGRWMRETGGEESETEIPAAQRQ